MQILLVWTSRMGGFGLRKSFNLSIIMATLVAEAVNSFADILKMAASSRSRNVYKLGAITHEYSR